MSDGWHRKSLLSVEGNLRKTVVGLGGYVGTAHGARAKNLVANILFVSRCCCTQNRMKKSLSIELFIVAREGHNNKFGKITPSRFDDQLRH